MVYETLEPFGEHGHYFRNGILTSALLNIHRPEEDTPLYDASDFMPKFIPDEEDDSTDDAAAEHVAALHAAFVGLARRSNKKNKRKKKRA